MRKKIKILFINFYQKISQNFPVFSSYRSLSADDTSKNEVNDGNYLLNGVDQEKVALKIAQAKIKQLEKRLEELENRLPKQYDEVKFLNYQNRKRILVRTKNYPSKFIWLNFMV